MGEVSGISESVGIADGFEVFHSPSTGCGCGFESEGGWTDVQNFATSRIFSHATEADSASSELDADCVGGFVCSARADDRCVGRIFQDEAKKMKTKCIFILAVILSALLHLVGCTSSSGVLNPTTRVMTGKPVTLDYILVATNTASATFATEQNLLHDHIISGLRETHLFLGVSEDAAGSGVKVETTIKECTKVSDNSRLWFGALAGQARVVVQATVSDLSCGKQIEVFEAEGKSGKSAKAGTTDEACQRAAEQVVAEVVRLNAQSAQ